MCLPRERGGGPLHLKVSFTFALKDLVLPKVSCTFALKVSFTFAQRDLLLPKVSLSLGSHFYFSFTSEEVL